MPFVSDSQRRWMYANHPEMAKKWEEHTPSGKLPEKVKEAFLDELNKMAGVGWDLHGYNVDPEVFQQKLDEAREADLAHSQLMRSALGPGPAYPKAKKERGLFRRLFGMKAKVVPPTDRDYAAYSKAWDAHSKKMREYYQSNPPPADELDVLGSSRIPTPYDDKTNYKMNLLLSMNKGSEDIDHLVTDFDAPLKPLSKEDLQNVAAKYKTLLEKADPSWRQEGEAFLSKADHLSKDPNFRFAALEYE